MNKPTSQMEGNQPIAHQLGDKNGATANNLTQRHRTRNPDILHLPFRHSFRMHTITRKQVKYFKNSAETTLENVT